MGWRHREEVTSDWWIGAYPGWAGAVSPGDYDEVVSRLELAKERFLDRESTNFRGATGMEGGMAVRG